MHLTMKLTQDYLTKGHFNSYSFNFMKVIIPLLICNMIKLYTLFIKTSGFNLFCSNEGSWEHLFQQRFVRIPVATKVHGNTCSFKDLLTIKRFMSGVLSTAIDWASTKCYSTIVSFQYIELKGQDLLISVLPFKNRQGLDGGIRFAGKHRELLTKGFLIRAAQEYNSVPVLVSIRSKTSLPAFKQQLKEWVKSYIPSDWAMNICQILQQRKINTKVS